jgi:2-hydroxychromene-2-carboxylate isomerase
MAKSVEFYFDVGSPTAWLAWTQLPAIAAEADAELLARPVLLGGIFKATGNRPPAENPAKGQYLFRDLARFAERYDVTLNFNPHFPVNTLQCMRVLTAVQMYRPEEVSACIEALFRALWVEGLDAADETVLRDVLDHAGLEADTFLEWAGRDEVKEQLKAETDAAVQRGLFGVPTLFVGDEMFWGQDRLDFVRERLGA